MSVGSRSEIEGPEWCFERSVSHPTPGPLVIKTMDFPGNTVLRLEKVRERSLILSLRNSLRKKKDIQEENFLIIFILC